MPLHVDNGIHHNQMYHCHILEHHAAGMMAHFNVV